MGRTNLLGAGLVLALVAALPAACGDDGGTASGGGSDAGDGADREPGADSSVPLLDGDAPPAVDAAVPPTPAPFGLDSRPPNPSCLAPARPPSSVAVKLAPVFATVKLDTPLMMRQIPGDPSRFFVAQRAGTLVSFPVASPPTGPATVVLTLKDPPTFVPSTTGEGGFLGFAFHPKFAQNGRVFLSYTATDASVAGSGMRSVIARMESTDGGKTFGNYTEIVAFNQTTATNHKGGSIAFGPDGYLYFGFGDGGGGGDTFTNGQKKDGYFAKIHRIDVDTPPAAGKTYVVPDGNPFKAGGGQDSAYAYGLRNPFRFSFDRGAGDLWVGDVGQGAYEEIDKVQAPGANLGWPCREGTHDYASTDPTKCPNPKAGFLEPVFDYIHNSGAGKAITGGVVYRGKALPAMVGTYFFADEVTGEVNALTYDPATGAPASKQINASGPTGNWVNFAEDEDGEVYVVDISGKIYELVANDVADAGAPAAPFPQKLSGTGCVDPNDARKPAAGLIPYGVNSPLWSDGATKERWLAVPDGKTVTVGADGHFDLPIGSVLVKTFAVAGKRTETRLLVRHADGGWAGYTYEWNDAGTDATLLPSSKSKAVPAAVGGGTQTWYYPARSDCFNCHSGAAQRTLGMELGQLNGDEVYPSTNRVSNQLATLEHIGLFSAPLGTTPDKIVAYPSPAGTAPVEARARAYLHANCSMCHRPNSNGGGPMDLRFATALADTKACNVSPDDGDLGVAGARLLVPGDPTKSIASLRPHARDATRMPPLASSVVDTAGVGVIDAWITSLKACAGPSDASDQ